MKSVEVWKEASRSLSFESMQHVNKSPKFDDYLEQLAVMQKPWHNGNH